MSYAAELHAAHLDRIARIEAHAVPDDRAEPVEKDWAKPEYLWKTLRKAPPPMPVKRNGQVRAVLRYDAPIGPPRPVVKISTRTIKRVVADEAGITVDELEGPCRMHKFVRARQFAMWLIRVRRGRSLGEIGVAFEARDHSTVFHAVHKIEAELAKGSDAELMRLAAAVETRLNGVR